MRLDPAPSHAQNGAMRGSGARDGAVNRAVIPHDERDPHHANGGRRIAAFAFDYLLLLGYMLGLAVVSVVVRVGVLGGFQDLGEPWRYDLLAFLTLVLPVFLYFSLSEASSVHATWGKRRLGLCVVAREGGQLGKGRSFLRSGLKFLPWQIAHTCLFNIPGWPVAPLTPPMWVVGGLVLACALVVTFLLQLLVSPTHQTFYDWAAGSQVVVAGSSRLQTSAAAHRR